MNFLADENIDQPILIIKPSRKEILVNKLYVVFIVLLLGAFVVGCGSLIKPESEQKTTEQIKKSVVRIRAENQMNGEKREGTGFVVGVSDDKAYIVTVSHVVEGDPKPTVEFVENNEFEAEVLDSEAQENGLALLSVKGLIPYDVMPLYLVKKRNLNSGDALFTIGFPRGGARWAHDELSYSGKIRRNLIFSGSNEKEGNSGSPVIKGEQVVAIITSITDYAYAISAESTREFLDGAKGGKPVIDNLEKWKPSKWRRTQEARLENAKFVINEQARLKEIELKIAAAKVRLREAEAKVAMAEQARLQAEAEVKLVKADAKIEAKLAAAKQTRKQAEIEIAQAKANIEKAEQQRFTTMQARRKLSYVGGGYTVTIEGVQNLASYTGCNSKGKCLHIPKAAHYTEGDYTWKNRGHIYRMSPMEQPGQYQLMVFDPKGKQILNQVMMQSKR